MRRLEQFLRHFDNSAPDASGAPAIRSITLWQEEDLSRRLDDTRPLVVVMVEQRIVLAGSTAIADALRTHRDDLRREGYEAVVISVAFGQSTTQDGKVLLVLREMLRQVRAEFPKLAGVVMVGAFPEAIVVGRQAWRRHGASWDGLPSMPGPNAWVWILEAGVLADRSDIVLADLDGAWAERYIEAPTQIEGFALEAEMEDLASGRALVRSRNYRIDAKTLQDCFFVDDGEFRWVNRFAPIAGSIARVAHAAGLAPTPPSASTAPEDGVIELDISLEHRNPELSPADRARLCPLAQPAISVSRINARNVARQPPVGYLDAEGRPTVWVAPSPSSDPPPGFPSTIKDLTRLDETLEVRLIVEYFERNHAHRTAHHTSRNRIVASISGTTDFSARDFAAAFIAAPRGWSEGAVSERADLQDWVRWLQEPALVRMVIAHSDSWGSTFDGIDYVALTELTGGLPFRWTWEYSQATPSFLMQGPYSDFWLQRTLWVNRALRRTPPAFFIHGGCDTNSVDSGPVARFQDAGYAFTQNAELLLFYTQGLAVMSRAKVYNDRPDAFSEALAKGTARNFGDAMRVYFDAEASRELYRNLDQRLYAAPDLKRAYAWSVIGDWTLRVSNAP